jgi:hypothetical protein
LKNHNLILKSNITSYTNDLTKKLAMEGLGIGWGLKKCVEKELSQEELFEIPVEFDNLKTKFSIAYDSKFISNTTMEFINYFKEKINDVL